MFTDILGYVALSLLALNIGQMVVFFSAVWWEGYITRHEDAKSDEGREAAYWAALDKKLRKKGGGVTQ